MSFAPEPAVVKMYSDYKSPYAYLAFDPAFDLETRYRVTMRWIPFQLRIKGKGERSLYSEHKAKYSYLDARRSAKPRGLVIRGPKKVYDTTPALVAGLFAERHGRLRDYSRLAYERFFRRELEADDADAVAALVAELDLSASDYRDYLAGEGLRAYEQAQQEAAGDHVFGVPLFLFAGEPFWGHDRLALLEQRLAEAGLALEPTRHPASGLRSPHPKETLMQARPVNPQTWLGGFHVNQAIEVTGGQRVLYVSGQTSNDATGAAKHPGDIVAQFRLAWQNLVEVLAASNMKPENIVRLNFYTTDVDAFMAKAEQLVPIWASAGCKPVSTLLGVARLFEPSILVEIEATAVA